MCLVSPGSGGEMEGNIEKLFNLVNKVKKWLHFASKKMIHTFIFLFILTMFIIIERESFFEEFKHHNYSRDNYNFLIEHNESDVTSTRGKSAKPRYKDSKYILYFHPYFEWEDWNFGLGHEPFVAAGCPVSNCFVTNNRTMLDSIDQFDAILFHARNMDPNEKYSKLVQGKVPIPNQNKRRRDQRYVFFQMESPANDPLNYSFTPQFRGFFNWTMTFRLDSDLARPYGWIADKSDAFKYFPDFRPWKPFQPLGKQQMQKYNTSRPKLVAWVVSHCETASAREDYVSALRQLVPVDQFGHCGSTPCQAQATINTDNYVEKCGHNIVKDYKFLLAFENSVCKDYVTEKMYNALEAGLVPVVMGGADYKAMAPPGSYIDVNDYKSPTELADKLLALHKDEEQYLQYFWWREHYRVYPRISAGAANSMCRLCQKLHEDRQEKVYGDLGVWWDGLGNCRRRNDLPWAQSKTTCVMKDWLCYHWK